MALTINKKKNCFCETDKPNFCFKIENEVIKDKSPLICCDCNMTTNEHNFSFYLPFTEYIKKDEKDIIIELPKYEFIFDKNDILVLT